MATKVAVLLQYLRIFVPSRNRCFWLTWSLITVNVIINLALAVSFGFQCLPRPKIWTPTLEGQCINLGAAFLISAVANTITDIAVFLLPLYSIWDLQLPWERKVGVSAVFAVGLFACIASIMRLVTSVPLLHTDNSTYHLANPYLWALAEITSGVICICAPVLPKLFQHVSGRVQSMSNKSSSRRSTPIALSGGSKRSTLDRQKPYIELGERDRTGNSAVAVSYDQESKDSEQRWKHDVEGRATEDGLIRKTVTIDQTSRAIR
ncbi:MAG: hypothetical protein Q9174_004860 [Haloplaca sp. 1 TL-2023]